MGKQWTEHFNEAEFTVSHSHPDLVVRIPSKYQDAMMRVAVELLQPIREQLGRDIIVLSGYRSPELNAAVGGSRTSQHVVGEAADGTATDLREVIYIIIDLVEWGKLSTAGQIIYYPDKAFFHIALASRRFTKPTLCIKWPAQDYNYTQCIMTREAFDEMVPPHLDPNYDI